MGYRSYAMVVGLGLAVLSGAAQAYATFPDGNGGVLKWGGDNTPGTPGGSVTWGFIPEGTAGSAYCDSACSGTAKTSIWIENSPGTGYTLTPLTDLIGYIQAAFDKWAGVANISFVGPLSDSGLPINHAGAGVPDIRIGAFDFSSGGGAVGYAPPPNGGTGSGDIIFAANSFYAFQPGNDGELFPSASTAPNDFESLLLHEMGHALGLAHPPVGGGCPVMQVVDSACWFRINRELDADDIAGAQYLYGAPAAVPLPAAAGLFASGLFGVLAGRRKRRMV